MGILNTAGERHKKQRKIITPVFHFGALKLSSKVMERNALHFVENVLETKGSIIDADTFKSLTLDVICDYAFSGAFDKKWMGEAWGFIMKALKILNAFQIFVGDFVKYLPNPCSIYLWILRWQVRRYLDDRRRFLSQSQISHTAVLDYLDASQTDGGAAAGGGKEGGSLSIDLGVNLADQLLLSGCPSDVVVDECMTFLFAGRDTTSSLLSWASLELSRHPEEQALVRDELTRVIGPGPVTSVPYESIPRLERTTAVLREALRLWPPFPVFVRHHYVSGGLKVDGLAVPDGGAVSISPYLAHRDPRFWPEPDTFRPARWLLPSSDPEVQLRHPYA
jgi:cytochrome P450